MNLTHCKSGAGRILVLLVKWQDGEWLMSDCSKNIKYKDLRLESFSIKVSAFIEMLFILYLITASLIVMPFLYYLVSSL